MTSTAPGDLLHDGRAEVCYIHSRQAPGDLIASRLTGGFRVSTVVADRRLTESVTGLRPDVLVIDASTDGFDAVRLCRDVRDAIGLPIVVLIDGHSERERLTIDLLDAGAAEVVAATASPELLHAHVRAALRSVHRYRRPGRLAVGDVVIDLDAHVLYIGGDVVDCPPLLFSLLAALASTPNTVATREALLSRVWGVKPGTVDTRRVRVAASLLRRMLGEGPHRPRLETVARIGYRLAVD